MQSPSWAALAADLKAMSDIVPPHVAGSAAQSGYVQSEVARNRNAARAGEASAARRTARAIDDAGNLIETSDNDTAVFTDAEGAGGQGREPDAEDHQHPDDRAETEDGGLTRGNDGRMHLDVEA